MPQYSIGRFRGELALVFYQAGKRHRYALGTADRREAERRAPALYAELTRPRGTTVADIWTAYTMDKAGRAVIGTMKHTWKALEHRFGSIQGDRVTVEACREYVAARRRAGIKDGTIHTELGHLRMVLVWGEKRQLIPRASYIERPSKPKSGEKHLTRNQVRQLFEIIRFPHLRLFAILAYTTTARSAAILGLTWSRCDSTVARLTFATQR
jgi:hypothetical protein